MQSPYLHVRIWWSEGTLRNRLSLSIIWVSLGDKCLYLLSHPASTANILSFASLLSEFCLSLSFILFFYWMYHNAKKYCETWHYLDSDSFMALRILLSSWVILTVFNKLGGDVVICEDFEWLWKKKICKSPLIGKGKLAIADLLLCARSLVKWIPDRVREIENLSQGRFSNLCQRLTRGAFHHTWSV